MEPIDITDLLKKHNIDINNLPKHEPINKPEQIVDEETAYEFYSNEGYLPEYKKNLASMELKAEIDVDEQCIPRMPYLNDGFEWYCWCANAFLKKFHCEGENHNNGYREVLYRELNHMDDEELFMVINFIKEQTEFADLEWMNNNTKERYMKASILKAVESSFQSETQV